METQTDRSQFLLPPAAYRDPTWLAAEQAKVFRASWALVGDAARLTEVGDRTTAVVGRSPLVVVRTEGGLKAFHNVCRHRGMVVVESGCEDALRCSYHGWEWDLDGDLIRVPQRKTQFPDIEPTDLGLHPASVAEWEGMVFAHIEPDAPAFPAVRAGLDEHLGSFRPGLLDEVAHVRMPVACNWKLFVENHIDVYHLWYLHERSLADFEHASFEHHSLGHGSWASYEPMRRNAPGDDAPITHLDERDRRGIQAHMLFPNVLMAALPTFFATYAITPVNPTESVIDLRLRAEPTADVDALVADARSFIDEDIAACERVQQAIGAAHFGVGPLARTHESPITTFHRALLASLETPVLEPVPTH